MALIGTLSASLAVGLAQSVPWSPAANCPIALRDPAGLKPAALEQLKKIGVAHRITQTINPSHAPSNYHGVDVVIDGKSYTAAVDISVRCLNVRAIQSLLSSLASSGFAAWYRQNNLDDWKGPTHIHAVWAAEPLKPQLRLQVQSWLAGRTGLVGDAKYKFWQPTEAERKAVAASYESSRTAAEAPRGPQH